MTMGLYLSNIKKLDAVGNFQLQDCMTDISDVLSNLHVDYDDNNVPIIYDIPCSSIIELRGNSTSISISRQKMNLLLDRAITDVDEYTLLHYVCQLYTTHLARSNKYKYDILGYISFMFSKSTELKKLTDVIKTVDVEFKESCERDLEELRRLSALLDYDLE
jgi:hypothetical protein